MQISPVFLSVPHDRIQDRLTPSKGFGSKTTFGNGFYDQVLNPKVRQIMLTLILLFNTTKTLLHKLTLPLVDTL